MSIENKRREVLLSKEEIDHRVRGLGQQLTRVYEGKNLLVISLLKGSFIFTADLIRQIKLPLRIEFMTTSSYGHSEESTGRLEIVQDINVDLSAYDVLVVDDITDSAITMAGVIEILGKRNPKSIRSCVLLDKPSRRKVPYIPDYVGFEIPDKFIVGYGLNYGDYFRNIDHIFAFVD
ncbi:hypoxanthine phosphoribosyltransferase [Fusibacter paucivorans]|uniref:Hypoxanthine phosphoribosyltransferase n=1 Tax=Fusibacter paucivorans TaxID=76009 RepID=A0ABS5PKH9_9FIRM|nr:hypoxanthine phosphoribosyltransferase [Fusibacter paucivorans]MBS7525675.1 hypoxanthine phosphoribosyltransferase [Fusibacter paucivorans]